MAPPCFVFGAGVDYSFRGTGPPTLQEQQEDAEVDAARLQNELAAALAQIRRLGDQRDTARQAEGVARKALKQVRAAWTTPHPPASMADTNEKLAEKIAEKQTRIDELENEVAGLKRKQEHDTATIESYQNDVARSENNVRDSHSQLRTQIDKRAAAERQHAEERKQFERELEHYQEQLTQSHITAENLRREVNDHKAAADHNLSIFNIANAERQDIQAACDAALQAKDELEAQKLDAELRFNSLFEQWQEEQAEREEHGNCVAELEAYEVQQKNMEADYERQNNARADVDRALVVKDARIAELEQQLQRERQHNMNEADAATAANIAAATSHEHDAPPFLSTHSRALSDELLDYDEYDYMNIDHAVQHVDLAWSVITANSTAPLEPVRPELRIHMNGSVSVSPRDVPAPVLSLNKVEEIGSVTPQDVPVPELSIAAVKAIGSVAPEDVPGPKLSFNNVKVIGSVAPEDVPIPKLLFKYVKEIGSVSPAAPVVTPYVATSTQTQATQLTSGMVDSASIAVTPITPALNITTGPIKVTHQEAPLEVLPPLHMTTPVMVTHDEAPFKAQPSKGSTTSPAPPAVQPTRSTKFGALQLLHLVLTVLLTMLSLYLYSELEAWRTANGVGFHGNGGQYSRRGAYGNGRYLFGYIPIAMDVGNSPWSEFVARMGSVAITSFEAWAGIQNIPSY
jgi:hypothetical protein